MQLNSCSTQETQETTLIKKNKATDMNVISLSMRLSRSPQKSLCRFKFDTQMIKGYSFFNYETAIKQGGFTWMSQIVKLYRMRNSFLHTLKVLMTLSSSKVA